MTPFTPLTGIAAPLMEENVDTDIIFPARFLLITAREGLGRYAFHDRRFSADGSEQPDFILNQAPFRDARILIADANFGSGSSREQAVWALLGFGIRCVIAPSFGEIFEANCYRNGVLPITLPRDAIASLAQLARAGWGNFTVDLDAQQIVVDRGPTIAFTILPERRLALLNGWDETATILNTREADIATFEARQRSDQPWLWENA
ncbi:3-isopropylmalate/(R)-2-methylmalate dehydratase small subunit [Sphingomonas vulcanisoli]|uniref:3-isopropylmalate dehydratase small subunit n=1 Tax=Sphingomonas vulcanisoli TaxID=1658060 RepID=A0ABX0TVB1_9SPHN|nr:3-isopropylmalate dehydratase small subunit [Sphingomonas vulcanisoli]NIJ09472.1 3-isopropylmalate/(R)-2-methylmalate dehydratase small subunit [Sphingomonas vulcanisoli]